MHYSGPGLSENDSAVTTDVCEDQNREVGLWVNRANKVPAYGLSGKMAVNRMSSSLCDVSRILSYNLTIRPVNSFVSYSLRVSVAYVTSVSF